MSANLQSLIQEALEDLKAKEITVLDVSHLTDVMDKIFIVTGSSNRHVKSLADNVATEAKHAGIQPLGVEGMEKGDWVLVDLGDIVVHCMNEETRDFYDLERLWSEPRVDNSPNDLEDFDN